MSLLLSRLFQNRASTVSVINNNVKKIVGEGGSVFVQIRGYAARKGYREKREKSRVKKEVVKREFVPHNILKKQLALKHRRSRIVDESKLKEPLDDVYYQLFFKQKVYPFAEAVQCHREANHSEILNGPNAKVEALIELNTQGEKKTRYVDNFTRVAAIPHKFEQDDERLLLAFSKSEETYDDIRNAGAQLVGGVDLIKQIQTGKLSLQDFNYVIAHPNILPELSALRGLMKRRFPNPAHGTLDADLVKTTERFIHGICYTVVKDEYEKEFGTINAVIGTLDMDEKILEANFSALVLDINKMKPKRPGGFIRRALLLSKPNKEQFKVDYTIYTGETESTLKPEEAVAEN